MPLDDRILSLLSRYEDLRGQGQAVTPQELCRDCPELVPEVKRQLEALQALNELISTEKGVGAPPVPPEMPPPKTSTLRIRCPYCNNPIQLADDRSDEVLCPVCGSNFRVQDTRMTSTT